MNEFLFGLSIGTWVLYIGTIWIMFGVQYSVSSSYYLLKKKKPLFTLVMWLTIIPLMLVSQTLLTFIAGMGICLVGVAPDYRLWKQELIAHLIGSYLGVLGAIATIWIDYHLWYVSVPLMVFIALAKFLNMKNHIWWIENVALIATWIVIYFKIIV